MRISDWSSDVCSSELFGAHELAEHDAGIFFFEPLAFIMAEPFLHKQRRDAAHRHARHAFDAARAHDILRARHPLLRGKLAPLLRRTALAVDRHRAVGRTTIRASMLTSEYTSWCGLLLKTTPNN